MSAERYTLVTEVTVITPEGVTNRSDVITHVGITPRRTTITFGAASPDVAGGRNWSARANRVEVTLTEAERIALIEALGGVAR